MGAFLNISNASAAGEGEALLGWWPHPLAPHPLAPHPWAPHPWAPHPWAPHPWAPHPWHLWASPNASESQENMTVELTAESNASAFLNISNASAAGEGEAVLGWFSAHWPQAPPRSDFCLSRSVGWFCRGFTHVKCCRYTWGFGECGTVVNYHGCGWRGVR